MSLLSAILSSRRFKALAVASWLGYWLLYAFSDGMLFYYSTDITPLLKASQVPNAYFLNYYSSLSDFYSSGIVWYPNGHLQVTLIYGLFIYSLVLASLFSMNVVLTSFSVRFSRVNRGAAQLGALALIPALFSGGCCSVPLGLAVVGFIAPTAGLTTLVYGYPFWMNPVFTILLSLSLIYSGKKVVRECHLLLGREVG